MNPHPPAAKVGAFAPGPDGTDLSVFDAAQAFAAQRMPLVVFAGAQYGTGSARDWAAKGTALLGIRAVIARSFERIHRANLVAMGVLPVVWDEDATVVVRADSRIAIWGLDRLGQESRALEIGIAAPDANMQRYPARADIGSASQIAMIREGGLFGRFARRFGE